MERPIAIFNPMGAGQDVSRPAVEMAQKIAMSNATTATSAMEMAARPSARLKTAQDQFVLVAMEGQERHRTSPEDARQAVAVLAAGLCLLWDC